MEPQTNKWYIRITKAEDFNLTELIYLTSNKIEDDIFSSYRIVNTQYKYPDSTVDIVSMTNNTVCALTDIADFKPCDKPLEYLKSWTKQYRDKM